MADVVKMERCKLCGCSTTHRHAYLTCAAPKCPYNQQKVATVKSCELCHASSACTWIGCKHPDYTPALSLPQLAIRFAPILKDDERYEVRVKGETLMLCSVHTMGSLTPDGRVTTYCQPHEWPKGLTEQHVIAAVKAYRENKKETVS